MNLMKKTKVGTLTAGYRPGETRPGFWVSILRNKRMHPLCTVEYDPERDCILLMVFANGNAEYPTHIIEINPDRFGKEG